MITDFSIFAQRRAALVDILKTSFGVEQGAVILFAGFEHEHYRYRQDSSFYYFTGIQEPATILWLELDGRATLYLPNYGDKRAVWMHTWLLPTEEVAQQIQVAEIKLLGALSKTFEICPLLHPEEYEQLLARLRSSVEQSRHLFTISKCMLMEQRFMLNQLANYIPNLHWHDAAPQIAKLRRKKDSSEIEALYQAVDVTMMAHEGASRVIKPDNYEYQVQAALEYVFTEAGSQGAAFPSIVGSGINSTVLHYRENNRQMKKGDLVVVDIGAMYDQYCADLTRTFPVGGKFSDRQREVYNIVLDCQQFIAGIAAPGYWLNNKDEPDKSLNHLARAFLKEKANYELPHGIGHFLGLDVHDVGSSAEPLQEGDVITIEPGIYLPQEELGVRIEDNYWIVNGGNVCLSEQLPSSADEIEKLMVGG